MPKRNLSRTVGRWRSFALAVLACSAIAVPQSAGRAETGAMADYARQASAGVKTLQGWYVESSGLYQKPTDWWNTANAMTVLVDYSRITGDKQYMGAVRNTFSQANKAYGITNFLNDSNDDEGWWALAWIDAYDETHSQDYLAMAETIFADMTTQWETKTCGGGVWWSKDLKHSAYKNAITNELFMEIAASLANRDGAKKAEYLVWAKKEWQWFHSSGMINADGLVNDGLNASNPAACTNNKQTTWTYNQGVILGALAELNKAEPDAALLAQAETIATAAMAKLVTKGGVLEEPPGGGPDLPQFKGVFLRNLVKLNRAAPKARYKAFAEVNARSIWSNDQGPKVEFGNRWEGPFDWGDGTRQTSALDAILAAAAMR